MSVSHTAAGSRAPAVRPLSFVRFDTQFENAGDCLINRELVRLVRERGDVCLGTGGCPAGFADQVAAGLGEGERCGSSLAFFSRMMKARMGGRRCLWFQMPGGVAGGFHRGGASEARLRDVPLQAAALARVRVCKIGSSFGGLTPEHLEAWRRRRKWLAVLSPRDSTSAAYLGTHGIPCEPCIPDLAFHLFGGEAGTSGTTDGLLRRPCFSFRTDQYPGQLVEVEAIAAAVCARQAPGTRWRMVAQVARDLDGMGRLRARLAGAGFGLDPVEDLHSDIERCLAFYRGVSFVVSNRLHVLLMAASQGARVLAVTGGPTGAKIEGLFQDLGCARALVDPNAPGEAVSIQEAASRMRRELRLGFDRLLFERAG